MKFFLDNNISHRLAAALLVLENRVERGDWTVEHLRVRFEQQTEDVTWLEALGREGEWIVISGDIRISRNPAEKAAWRESGLTAFFFASQYPEKNIWTQVMHFLRWWPEITREAREHREAPEGSGYVIPMQGKKWKIITHD
ncbi:MAG: hypothetical protein OXE49_04875 [Gemmatimonadetes bacterium]|nr:hypothetical protein [Gemmatimonadota bacterium]